MNTEQQIRAAAIKQKVERNEPLDRKENIFYLTVVLGHTLQEAQTIIAIAENTDPLVIID